MARLPVKKTYKLFIGGAFPRSESGRTYEAQGQNVARASRKDARDAVVAARGGAAEVGGATAYNRGQVLYRIAEMMEARIGRVRRALDRAATRSSGRSIAGSGTPASPTSWRRCSASSNPVAGPYFNFTVPGADRRRRDRRAGGAAAARPRLADRAGARRRQRGRRGRLRGEPARRDRARRGARDERPARRRRQPAHRPPRRARAVARLAHGRERDRPHRRRRRSAPTSSAPPPTTSSASSSASPDSQSLYEISAFLELKTVWHPIGV